MQIIITAVIVVALAAAVFAVVRSKRRGTSCSCGCENCEKNKPSSQTSDNS